MTQAVVLIVGISAYVLAGWVGVGVAYGAMCVIVCVFMLVERVGAEARHDAWRRVLPEAQRRARREEDAERERERRERLAVTLKEMQEIADRYRARWSPPR